MGSLSGEETRPPHCFERNLSGAKSLLFRSAADRSLLEAVVLKLFGLRTSLPSQKLLRIPKNFLICGLYLSTFPILEIENENMHILNVIY